MAVWTTNSTNGALSSRPPGGFIYKPHLVIFPHCEGIEVSLAKRSTCVSFSRQQIDIAAIAPYYPATKINYNHVTIAAAKIEAPKIPVVVEKALSRGEPPLQQTTRHQTLMPNKRSSAVGQF